MSEKREFPILNGKLLSDLDLNGHKLLGLNIPEGGGGGVAELMIETTHADLVALRNNGGLIPGMQYRITDYVATTVQERTQSANHPFDIIVTADSPNKLNEVARAIRHNGDTYFPETTKFDAWQIWYSLDNDTNRFGWADEENGKGVIYRMIDEFNNDVPYDFKGIKMQAFLGVHDETGEPVCSEDFRYTFGIDVDDTLYGDSYANVMKPRTYNYLHNINCNIFGPLCYNNTLGPDCVNNTFGSECICNTFNSSCVFNIFGSFVSYHTLGTDCSCNTFGSGCYHNTFGSGCFENTLGTDCNYNTFSTQCSYNALSDFFNAVILQGYIYENIINCSADRGDYEYCQYIEIKSGVSDKEINIDDVEQSYHTEIRPENSITITV